MGQKTHPIGFRLGTTRDWVSHWFGVNPRDYRVQVLEDHKIRDHIKSELGDSSGCLLYTSPSPRDTSSSRMPSSA